MRTILRLLCFAVGKAFAGAPDLLSVGFQQQPDAVLEAI